MEERDRDRGLARISLLPSAEMDKGSPCHTPSTTCPAFSTFLLRVLLPPRTVQVYPPPSLRDVCRATEYTTPYARETSYRVLVVVLRSSKFLDTFVKSRGSVGLDPSAPVAARSTEYTSYSVHHHPLVCLRVGCRRAVACASEVVRKGRLRRSMPIARSGGRGTEPGSKHEYIKSRTSRALSSMSAAGLSIITPLLLLLPSSYRSKNSRSG